MEKLFSVANVILTQVLFLMVEVGFVLALYNAAVDKDRSLLIIAVILRIAKQCIIPMWRRDVMAMKEAFDDGERD